MTICSKLLSTIFGKWSYNGWWNQRWTMNRSRWRLLYISHCFLELVVWIFHFWGLSLNNQPCFFLFWWSSRDSSSHGSKLTTNLRAVFPSTRRNGHHQGGSSFTSYKLRWCKDNGAQVELLTVATVVGLRNMRLKKCHWNNRDQLLFDDSSVVIWLVIFKIEMCGWFSSKGFGQQDFSNQQPFILELSYTNFKGPHIMPKRCLFKPASQRSGPYKLFPPFLRHQNSQPSPFFVAK